MAAIKIFLAVKTHRAIAKPFFSKKMPMPQLLLVRSKPTIDNRSTASEWRVGLRPELRKQFLKMTGGMRRSDGIATGQISVIKHLSWDVLLANYGKHSKKSSWQRSIVDLVALVRVQMADLTCSSSWKDPNKGDRRWKSCKVSWRS